MAMITVQWDMSEVKELMRKLQNAGKSGSKALVHGGMVVVTHAKLNAEGHGLHKTGDLIGSINVYDIEQYSVMVGSRGVIYAMAHEFGVTIYPRRKKFLSWIDEGTGERIFAKRVTIPARSYLRPAFDEHKTDITNAIANVIAQELS